jgi:hypothetical protein
VRAIRGTGHCAGLDASDACEIRRACFYYSGSTPSAVRYKNWKMYYTMSQHGAAGWLEPLTTWHFPLIQNIKRDPFEQFVEPNDTKSLMGFGGPHSPPQAQPLCTTDLP